MMRLLPYAVFIAIMFTVGFTASAWSIPGEWYATLEKPWFNPPNWVFGPAWTFLYILIGIAGAMGWNSAARGPLTALWGVQLLLNGAWSLSFFAMRQPSLALAVVLALLAAIIAFAVKAWSPARIAALLFLPYAAWVSFASVLNASIVYLN